MYPDHSPIEIAKLESAIAGILAGFALTVVVLLLERLSQQERGSKQDPHLGKAAILVFVGAFFTGTLSSFLYAVTAGESGPSPRLFLSLLMPAFTFSLTSVLIALGLVFLLVSYKFTFALKSVQFILFGTIFIAVFNYSSASLDAVAVMEQTTVSNLFGQTQMSLPIVVIPLISLLVGWAVRRRTIKENFNLNRLSNFVYFVILVSAIFGALAPFIHQSPTNIIVPNYIVFLPMILLAFFCGWAVMYIPKVTGTL